MVGPSKMSPDPFCRYLGVRTMEEVFDDMNKEFEGARAENEARRRERRRDSERLSI